MSSQSFIKPMLRAITLAKRGLPHTAPNPAVGAVLLKNGHVVAEGWHAKYGAAHAELAVLEDAQKKGINPADCVLVVTLEPCNHYGKTAPCTKAIVQAGIKHVVVGTPDPTPKAAGGAEFLRQNGVLVEMGVCQAECQALIADFLFWQNSKLPYVTLKMASTLDGCIATRTGKSRWITGPKARQRVHALRASAQAVMIGGATFRNDNPLLTVRANGFLGDLSSELGGDFLGEFTGDFMGVNASKISDNFPNDYLNEPSHCQKSAWLYLEPPQNFEQPLALVFSGQLPDLKLKSHLLTERPEKVIFVCAETSPLAKNKACVQNLGCKVLVVPTFSQMQTDELAKRELLEASGLPEQLKQLKQGQALCEKQLKFALEALRSKYNCWRILCEGGGQLALSLLKANLVQKFELHMAPCIMGDSEAKKIFEGLTPLEINETLPLELVRQGCLGKDIIMQFKPAFKPEIGAIANSSSEPKVPSGDHFV